MWRDPKEGFEVAADICREDDQAVWERHRPVSQGLLPLASGLTQLTLLLVMQHGQAACACWGPCLKEALVVDASARLCMEGSSRQNKQGCQPAVWADVGKACCNKACACAISRVGHLALHGEARGGHCCIRS